MIKILFVLDGPRDSITVPRFVENILGVKVEVETTQWAVLRQKGDKRGYHRQLRFAIVQAQDAQAVALVAVVDRDKAGRQERMKELKSARDIQLIFPVALGQAEPHGEAWLLDDPVAVKRGLKLPGSLEIPTVKKVNSPKEEIEQLRKGSDLSEAPIMEVLRAIMLHIDHTRFIHPDLTGFEAFEKDVRHHLKSVASGCGKECLCGDACK
jgi:hypothetical protein